jgi:hypothetical protein
VSRSSGWWCITSPNFFPVAVAHSGGKNMEPTAVATNALLKLLAQDLFTLLNSGHWFQLFVNDYVPTPNALANDFVPAYFAGYQPFNLAGQLQAPIQSMAGQYEIDGTAGPFGCTSGSQMVFGAWIADLSSVKIAVRFAAPFTFFGGSIESFPFAILVDAISILVA